MSYHPRLGEALVVLYPAATPNTDYVVQDDGAGPYLGSWSLPGNQPTEQEVTDAVAEIPAAQTLAKKVVSKTALEEDTSRARIDRATASLVVTQLNELRSWLASFKGEVAQAASLADLKTRVAGLPATPNITKAQAIAAIKAAIDQE